MDSIKNILFNKDFSEPPDIINIKEYIKDKYKVDCEVRIGHKGYVITLPSGSLASSFRLELPRFKRQLKIAQDISIRIR